MSITERVIHTHLLDPEGISQQECIDLVTIDAEVRREIFCPVTGTVLDSRTAVLIVTANDGEVVVSPEAVESAEETLQRHGIDIVRIVRATELVKRLR